MLRRLHGSDLVFFPQVEDFKEAMTWYDFSLNCLKTGNQGNKNLAKLQVHLVMEFLH